MKNYSHTIEDFFITKLGIRKEIRNIHFEKIEDLSHDVGKFIIATTPIKSNSSDVGIRLYQSYYDPKRALRIYKDYVDYPYSFHCDDIFISKLQAKQEMIKLTEFPLGVVTLGKSVIGQEIPYYEDYLTIGKAFLAGNLCEVPTYYYLKMYEIIKELYDKGIIYVDTHARNFLVNNLDVKLIDFEDRYLSFKPNDKIMYDHLIDNMKSMLIKLSDIYHINLNNNFSKIVNLQELEESLQESHYVLTKKIKVKTNKFFWIF